MSTPTKKAPPREIAEAADILCYRLNKDVGGKWEASTHEDTALADHWYYSARSACGCIWVSQAAMHGGKNQGQYSAMVIPPGHGGAPHSSWCTDGHDTPGAAVRKVIAQVKEWVAYYVEATKGL